MKKTIVILIVVFVFVFSMVTGCIFDDDGKSDNEPNRCINFHIEQIKSKDYDFMNNTLIINGTFIDSDFGYTYREWFATGLTIKIAKLKPNIEYSFTINLNYNNSDLKLYGYEEVIDGSLKFSNDNKLYVKILNGNSSFIEDHSKEFILDQDDNQVISFHGIDVDISIRLVTFIIN